MSRRAVLAGIATGAGAAAAGAAVWPLAAAIVDPLLDDTSPQDAPWVEVAGEKELRLDVPLKATVRVAVRDGFFTTLVELGAVWLQKRPDGKITALSNTCPHLGCGIGLDPKGGFACPCHDSRFAIDGSYVNGPSPRSMDPLPVRVEQGRVLVQALRFATGTKVRRPI
ncbi:MAG: Rieske (2Fe-2S) protein [Myxococcales bacterium]|nr:Rieske (2Fe-2S) protein [Myxococcales bacterium]